MKQDEIVKKYVANPEGIIAEMEKVVVQPQIQIGEQFVVFIFGLIFRHLKFKDIEIGHLKDLETKLDAFALLGENDDEIHVEFERSSNKFKPHIAKGHVKPEDYKNTLIVCWDDNWQANPGIDVLALEPFWKKANPDA
jgi:hypothetical protein